MRCCVQDFLGDTCPDSWFLFYCQSSNTHPGARAYHFVLSACFCIDLQPLEVREHILFISIFPAWHGALAHLRHSVNSTDQPPELERTEEKSLMCLLLGSAFPSIHSRTHSQTCALRCEPADSSLLLSMRNGWLSLDNI